MNFDAPQRQRSQHSIRFTIVLLIACTTLAARTSSGQESVAFSLAQYDPSCGIDITHDDTLVRVSWPIGEERRGEMHFDLSGDRPLIHSVAIASENGALETIAEDLDPLILLRVGKRDLEKRSGWTIFFDRMQRKPSELFRARVDVQQASAASHARRATLSIGNVTAGPFKGQLRWTFFADNQFVLQEAIVRTAQNGVAYLYDAGLVCRGEMPEQAAWRDSLGLAQSAEVDSIDHAQTLAVRGRSIGAQFDQGSIAVFPPPHRYFYPLDFSDNLSNVWLGPRYGDQPEPFGFGIRHDPEGDNRFVPWFNAPPGSDQQLGLFLWLSDTSIDQSLNDVGRLTRGDRFEPLAGHKVFTSHYHVEHTQEILESQEEPKADDDATGQLPSSEQYRIPKRLIRPGFTEMFRRLGVDIVHLAEFHFGRTPRMTMEQRVRGLATLHAECKRLSDADLLLLPGEEPNVHLGGHWISFFPTPVYWVLNRDGDAPFVTEHADYGRVYSVGGKADVLRLLREERGLAWTAHARIKGSTGFPDRYRDQLFFESDRFLGAAWKAMPADLSVPRLGSRVLDLMDDMSNWGEPKYVLGEVDVFKIQPDHELYGHMNVNYLRLDETPSFDDGWQSVLDSLREGKFFVTTGEVLIPDFTVDTARSGEIVDIEAGKTAKVRLSLKWTFPLAYADVITGDGREIKRTRVDLSETNSFGEHTFEIDADVSGQRWLRVEVWDVATNGAFTQPVWLRR